MNITRDVIKDLIAVYLAGEASDDTRALVESCLQADPELAKDVEAARAMPLALPATHAATTEKQALEATRQQLRSRTSTLAIAMVFTVLPLTCAGHDATVTFFLIRDEPVIGIAFWATAVVMWIWHASIRRRLRVSGL